MRLICPHAGALLCVKSANAVKLKMQLLGDLRAS